MWHLGRVPGSWGAFTWDRRRNAESVRELAAERSTVAFVGHGRPIRGDAAARLKELAAKL